MSAGLGFDPAAIRDLTLRSPVLVASGCGGTGRELAPYTPLDRVGAFVTRSLTLDPRPGGPAPRVVESASGLVHAGGYPNPGLESFLALELPPLLQAGAKVVVSVTGASADEHAELAARLGRAPGVAALEVPLGAPDAAAAGLLEVAGAREAAALVAAVVAALPAGVPVLAKLPPGGIGGAGAVELAGAVAGAGAAAVVLGQPLPALLADGRAAGLSGPAVLPVALRCVAEVRAQVPGLAVLGAGGVRTVADVRAFLAAGAAAVQVGAALLHDPTTAGRLAAELDPAPEETAR